MGVARRGDGTGQGRGREEGRLQGRGELERDKGAEDDLHRRRRSLFCSPHPDQKCDGGGNDGLLRALRLSQSRGREAEEKLAAVSTSN